MTSNYVRGASLSCSSLQTDIQQMLDGAGAHDCRITSEHGNGAVTFSFGDHQFRLVLPHPEPTDPPRMRRQGPVQRNINGQEHPADLEAARHSWRQLSLLIKAKLEAVAAGIVTFDEEFLAYMLMPEGGTVFQATAPTIASSYAAVEVLHMSGLATAAARTSSN